MLSPGFIYEPYAPREAIPFWRRLVGFQVSFILVLQACAFYERLFYYIGVTRISS